MKTLLALVFCMSTLAQAEVRDLKKHPLTPEEWTAYHVAKDFGIQFGEIRPECVNADFMPGETPVTLQFYHNPPEHRDHCEDPHYSVNVEFDKDGNVIAITLTDA